MAEKEIIIYLKIGEIIRIYRERANLSKSDIAKQLGVTAATITNYEKGRTPLPYKKILKFRQIFGKEFEIIINMMSEERTDFISRIVV